MTTFGVGSFTRTMYPNFVSKTRRCNKNSEANCRTKTILATVLAGFLLCNGAYGQTSIAINSVAEKNDPDKESPALGPTLTKASSENNVGACAEKDISCWTVETAKSADSFVDSIGVNTHLDYLTSPYYTDFSHVILPAFEASGIRHVRGALYSSSSRSTAATTALIAKVSSNTGARIGFTLTGVVWDCPEFMSLISRTEKPSAPFPVENLSWIPLANIDAFEGLNEWNFSPCKGAIPWNTQNFIYQSSLYRRVKEDPALASIPVIGPSVAYYSPGGLRKDTETIGDLTAYIDYANAHYYAEQHTPTWRLKDIKASLVPMNGTKPLIITESGYHTDIFARGISEYAQGKYYSRLFFEYLNAGIVRTFAYELLDDPSVAKADDAMGGGEANFGLIHSDGSYKPAFTAISNEIAILKDPGSSFKPGTLTYKLLNAPSQVHHTLLQKHDGTFYLALWQEVDNFNDATGANIDVPQVPVTINFADAISKINLFEPEHSLVSLELYHHPSTIDVELGDQLVLLEISK